MSNRNWSPNRVSWQESLAFSLTFLLWLESPFFFSEFLRGIAVGVGACSTLFMLSRRHGWYSLACAGLTLTSWHMTPLSRSGAFAICAQPFALMSAANPVVTWFRERKLSAAGSPTHS